MRRWIAALTLTLALLAWHAEVWAACSSQTYILPDRILICTTCCLGSMCTTTCV